MTIQKPDIVKKAVLILWISLAIGIVKAFFGYPQLVEQTKATGGNEKLVIFTLIFTVLLTSALIFAISKKQNWARWVFAVFFAIGIPLTFLALFQAFIDQGLLTGLIGIVQFIMQAIALVFLFQAPANLWFKSKKQQQVVL